MQQEGKLSLTVLDRSVKKCLTPRRNDLLLGAFAGRDHSTAGDLCFVTQSSVLYRANDAVTEKLVKALVHRVANDLYTAGNIRLMTAQAALTLPAEGFSEQELKSLIRILSRELAGIGADLSGGHTMRSAEVTSPILSLTMLGRKENTRSAEDSFAPESDEKDIEKTQEGCPNTGYAHASNDRKALDLILAGRIAGSGTGILAALSENPEGAKLASRYTADFISGAEAQDGLWSVKEAADQALDHAKAHEGVLSLHNLSEGGVFDGLWEFGERLGSGMNVDLRRIPISQETVELSEFFGVHPYRLYSTGALLIACADGEALTEKLQEAGIFAALIGVTTPGEKARVFRNEEETRYMEKPQGEELWPLLQAIARKNLHSTGDCDKIRV